MKHAARPLWAGRGQSTVEFMLMVPVIFAVFFFVIEMSLYFSAIHYTNYATYVVARCNETGNGKGTGRPRSATEIAALVLTGSVFQGNYTVSSTSAGGSNTGIKIKVNHWRTSFPYLNALMPDAGFAAQVNLGPDETIYEGRNKPACTDNDIYSNQC